jgi:hypothetical protein
MSIQEHNFFFFFGASSPLSNWYAKSFVVKGIRFAHVEQFMMYCKAKLFGDEVAAAKIMQSDNPAVSKEWGRKVKNFDKQVWDSKCRYYVYVGALAKFQQNPSTHAYLLSTNGKELVEAAGGDKIWGVGLWADDPRILDRNKWRGTNWLGLTLEQVRETILKQCSIHF